jgi:hypothetical protein
LSQRSETKNERRKSNAKRHACAEISMESQTHSHRRQGDYANHDESLTPASSELRHELDLPARPSDYAIRWRPRYDFVDAWISPTISPRPRMFLLV